MLNCKIKSIQKGIFLFRVRNQSYLSFLFCLIEFVNPKSAWERPPNLVNIVNFTPYLLIPQSNQHQMKRSVFSVWDAHWAYSLCQRDDKGVLYNKAIQPVQEMQEEQCNATILMNQFHLKLLWFLIPISCWKE